MRRYLLGFILIFIFLSLYISCEKKQSGESSVISEVNVDPIRVQPSIELVEPEAKPIIIEPTIVKAAPRKVEKINPTTPFQIEINASEGGRAFFKEERVLTGNPFIAIAQANEGYYFDHWEIQSGTTQDPVTLEQISIKEAENGISVKAIFNKALNTLFVNNRATSVGNGTHDTPYKSLSSATREAVSRIKKVNALKIEIRVASGNYQLARQEMLELVSGISIIGGFNPNSWEQEGKGAPPTLIRAASSFIAESLISISSIEGDHFSKNNTGEVSLSSLVIDGASNRARLISAENIHLKLAEIRLEGYGDSLVTAFNAGLTLVDSTLLSLGRRTTVINVGPASDPGVYIANNEILLGKETRKAQQAVGIQIYSPESLSYNSIQVIGNQILAHVNESFTGIKIDNGSMICNNNRIESFNPATSSSFGMELQGEAVVNKNWISIGSENGYGLSLRSNKSSGRILNNTIITRSISDNGKLTACGPISGDDLMISYNIFVNPAQSSEAVLGVNLLTEGHTVSNNRLISNNVEEKQFLIGLNGNMDVLPDELKSIAETAQEVEILY